MVTYLEKSINFSKFKNIINIILLITNVNYKYEGIRIRIHMKIDRVRVIYKITPF